MFCQWCGGKCDEKTQPCPSCGTEIAAEGRQFHEQKLDAKIDRALIIKMLEEHWRHSFLTCTSERELIVEEANLRRKFQQYGETLPASLQDDLIRIVQLEAAKFSSEAERDARGMRARLCGVPVRPQIVRHQSQGLTEIATETAVRATVWQLVASIFRHH